MATASAHQNTHENQSGGGPGTPARSRRGKTTHLKIVPPTKTLREQLRDRCRRLVSSLDRSSPRTKDEWEGMSRRLLDDMGLSEGYVGWTMVSLASAFWEDQVAAVPPSRRLLLLPRCPKHADGCRVNRDADDLGRRSCDVCSIFGFRAEAEQLGYQVLVAEGSAEVLSSMVRGHVDAIVGVACMNVLEKAMEKVLPAGTPCMAVPILSSDCEDGWIDEDWVREMIRLRRGQADCATRTYIHLMRCASSLFASEELDRLAKRLRRGPEPSEGHGHNDEMLDPVTATETIAFDFLSKGGKYSRPFITLAVYDALNEGKGTLPDGDRHVARFPDSVKRTAVSIETFHKASLVHDDIEDDDAYRYGDRTLHHRHGTPIAINVGDYLIGLGYRLVSREAAQLGADVVCDILDRLADAHLRLSEGQGAELAWRDARDKSLETIDALKIYALKTAPAFEAALYCGVRLAGEADGYLQHIREFARNVGVAFQILNDLKDWDGDHDNKLVSGADVLGGRPTLLLALALERLSPHDRKELLSLLHHPRQPDTLRVGRVGQLYHKAGVFDTAHGLVDQHRERARVVADRTAPDALGRLLRYVIDMLLDRSWDEPVGAFSPAAPAAPTRKPSA